MRLRGPTGKGESGLKGVALDFLEHLPPNQNLPALLLCASCLLFWHYQGAVPHHLFLEKVSLELLDNKSPGHSVSIQKPLWWLSSRPRLSCACDCLPSLDHKRHRKLKTSWECRGFWGVKIISIGLIKGFICWANTCCQIFVSFLCWYSWYIEKTSSNIDVWVKYLLCCNPLCLCSTGM